MKRNFDKVIIKSIQKEKIYIMRKKSKNKTFTNKKSRKFIFEGRNVKNNEWVKFIRSAGVTWRPQCDRPKPPPVLLFLPSIALLFLFYCSYFPTWTTCPNTLLHQNTWNILSINSSTTFVNSGTLLSLNRCNEVFCFLLA